MTHDRYPWLQLCVITSTYCVLLFVLMASPAWSDWRNLGALYLLLAAPFAMLFVAAPLRRQRSQSRLHQVAFWAAAVYPVGWLLVMLYALRLFARAVGE